MKAEQCTLLYTYGKRRVFKIVYLVRQDAAVRRHDAYRATALAGRLTLTPTRLLASQRKRLVLYCLPFSEYVANVSRHQGRLGDHYAHRLGLALDDDAQKQCVSLYNGRFRVPCLPERAWTGDRDAHTATSRQTHPTPIPSRVRIRNVETKSGCLIRSAHADRGHASAGTHARSRKQTGQQEDRFCKQTRKKVTRRRRLRTPRSRRSPR